MFHIVLYEPEIPANTGNLIRLSANTGCQLHLIRPLGFSLQSRHLRRAGLDYGDLTSLQVHDNLSACKAHIKSSGRLVTFSTKHKRIFSSFAYCAGDVFLFGPETRGLPQDVRMSADKSARLLIPMCSGNRSLNLSNAASIVVYEAWRQLGYSGAQECIHKDRVAEA